jgi:threonylcarbamoyladenosine tRNA methylthiotransferase MtaB
MANPEQHQNQVITFGCRLNTYESEAIKELSAKAGIQNAFIINTCAVTAEAERQARQEIRKIRRLNPDAKIIVTGCAAQINPHKFSEMNEVDQVIGNQEKMQPETYLKLAEGLMERVQVNDIMAVKETASHLVSGFDGKSRAFVQIQNGCNHRCTFCTIPYGRGNSRSVALGDIVKQIETLLENGYEEIVLTGVDITAYGEDLPGQPTLGQTIKRMLGLVPDLRRLRLSSLDPVEIDESLWHLIADEERLMPHLHLSLQAGDNMILKRMKRRHLREDAINFCQKAKTLRPDVAFGADLIAGFPTETEDMFQNSLRIVDECDLTFLHVFPYSARSNTPASKMPQVEKSLIKERASRLRTKGQRALNTFFKSQVGKTVPILVESLENGVVQGKTNQFAPVRIQTKLQGVQPIVHVTVTGFTDLHLEGVLA